MSEPSEEVDDDTCQCCGYPAHDVQKYKSDTQNTRGIDQEVRLLCGLCAGSLVSRFASYPRLHDRDILEVLKTICHVGNAIIDEIRRGKS